MAAATIEPTARRLIWERDGGICQICLLPVPFDRYMHIDHIAPYRLGGCSHPENLRATHSTCNLKRRDPGPGVWHCDPLPNRPRTLHVPRPKKARPPRRIKRTSSMPADMRQWLADTARRRKMTIADLFNGILRAAMDAEQRDREGAAA